MEKQITMTLNSKSYQKIIEQVLKNPEAPLIASQIVEALEDEKKATDSILQFFGDRRIENGVY